MTSDKTVALEQRVTARWAGDTWRTASLSGGFSGSLKYRLGEDMRHVILKFHRVACSATTDGNTIATLPSGYRPNSDAEVPLTVDHLDIGGTGNHQSPHVFVEASTGHLIGYGCQAATLVSLNHHMPIYDD